LGSAATAEVCIDFEGSLDFGYRLGETEYVFERSGQAPGGGVGPIGSRLEFPLNCLRLGLQARWGQDHLARPWDMTFSIHTGLNDPSADMLDHDWVTWPATGFDGKFSYTESDVDMRSVELALTGRWFIANPGSFHLGPWAGLRLQYFYQDVLGFDGWQIDFTDPPFNRRNVSDPRKGIIYRVTWLQFPLGLAWRLPVGRVMSGDVHAAMVPCWFSDYDDHLLRGKDAVASGFGFGFDARSSWEVILGPTPLRLRANLGFLYLKASGDQTQTWYTDDPGTPQHDETGQISEGLPHDVKTSQFDMSLTFVYGL
jgi:hypothetical protein